jgi:hypothetical protein
MARTSSRWIKPLATWNIRNPPPHARRSRTAINRNGPNLITTPSPALLFNVPSVAAPQFVPLARATDHTRLSVEAPQTSGKVQERVRRCFGWQTCSVGNGEERGCSLSSVHDVAYVGRIMLWRCVPFPGNELLAYVPLPRIQTQIHLFAFRSLPPH